MKNVVFGFLLWLAVVPLQAQISFDFQYLDAPGTGFNDLTFGTERRGELARAGQMLSAYFITGTPVTLTYSVTSITNSGTSLLASAGSSLISVESGFYPTVVQHKILTGVDANGGAADGEIDFNFGNDWGYGDSIDSNSYDFLSTAIHEALHSLGFLSVIDEEGVGAQENPSGTADGWTIFDRFLTDEDGFALVNPATFGFDPEQFDALESGMFFVGSNAMAAYAGNRVPLYAPDPWESGSSGSHLDDDTFTSTNPADFNALQMMNAATETGLGVRELSAVELGILRDLGYNVIPEPGTVSLLILTGAFVLWRGRTIRLRMIIRA